jgi:hypothetical protein
VDGGGAPEKLKEPAAAPPVPPASAKGSAEQKKAKDEALPGTMDVDIGGLQSKQTTIANTITQITKTYADPHGSAGVGFEPLGRRHFVPVARGVLASLTRPARFERTELRWLREALIRNNVSIISGPPEWGKGTLARRAAYGLWRARRAAIQEVLVAGSLERNVRVNLARIAEDAKQYGGRILIFEDAVSLGNPDLKGLFAGLDEASLKALNQRLARQDTYIFLTSDSDHVNIPVALDALGVHRRLEAFSPPLLARILRERLTTRLEGLSPDDHPARAVIESLLADREHKLDDIAARLGRPPYLVQFVDRILRDPRAYHLDLEGAVHDVNDLSAWLLDDLAADPRAWSYVIALTLASAAPPLRAVPWFQFHELWQRLCRFLERERRDETRALTPHDLGASDRLLRRARAEVRGSAFPEGATIRFEDPSYPERLWRVLLGRGRGLASVLVRFLRGVIDEGDFYLREAAGRSLGRLGELDPGYLVYPTISSYAQSDDPARHIALGKVLQGALGSRQPGYQEGCLRWLRDNTAGPEADAFRVRAVALREVGVFNAHLALTELRHLLDEGLGTKLDDLTGAHESLLRLEADVRRLASDAGTSRLVAAWHDEMLERIAAALFSPKERQVLAAVRFAIVGLCFAGDPIEVLSQLLTWSKDSNGSSPLVTLLFIDGDGIAVKLRDNKTPLWGTAPDAGSDSAFVCDRILAAASIGSASVERLCTFLEQTYRSIVSFPSTFRPGLRANFTAIITGWVDEAAAVAEIAPTVRGILNKLLAASDPELVEGVFTVVQRAASDRRPAVRAVALEILSGGA